MQLCEADIQGDLDRWRPGTSRFVTQRNEPDAVLDLSVVYHGKTTGTLIALLIQNTDQLTQYHEVLRLIDLRYGWPGNNLVGKHS